LFESKEVLPKVKVSTSPPARFERTWLAKLRLPPLWLDQIWTQAKPTGTAWETANLAYAISKTGVSLIGVRQRNAQ